MDQHFSFEFFPPKDAKQMQLLNVSLNLLAPLQPEFVSVTFGAGGTKARRELTLGTVKNIRDNTLLKVAPHLSCISSSKEELRDILKTYRELGINQIVALRGDIPEGEEAFKKDGLRYPNELVKLIKEFGGFEIHVGCYPEFHPESPTPESDLKYFAQKVKAGADFAITQYFFNNQAYYRFVEEAQKKGVNIPIVAGLMPITKFTQIDRFSKKCGADIPLWIRKRMEAFKNDIRSQQELGIDIATTQAEDLLKHGAPGIHFYTLNKAEATLRIWKNLGLDTSQEKSLGQQKDANYV